MILDIHLNCTRSLNIYLYIPIYMGIYTGADSLAQPKDGRHVEDARAIPSHTGRKTKLQAISYNTYLVSFVELPGSRYRDWQKPQFRCSPLCADSNRSWSSPLLVTSRSNSILNVSTLECLIHWDHICWKTPFVALHVMPLPAPEAPHRVLYSVQIGE